MNIVHVITSLGLGGAEKTVCDIADEQAHQGHTVTLISITGETLTKPTNENIKVISIGIKKKPTGFIYALNKLPKLILALDVDIIHAHMYHAIIITRLAIRNKTPLICTFHNSHEKSALRNKIIKATNKLARCTTCVSPMAAENYNTKIVIPNGLKIENYYQSKDEGKAIRNQHNISDSDYLYGFVGRLHEDKNIPLLLESFSEVNKNTPSSKLLIVGVGPLYQQLEKFVIEKNLINVVIFHGAEKNTRSIYNAMDLLIIPSVNEGFGLVAAESILCDTPVLSMDNGGVPFVLNSERFICHNKKELTDKMLACLNGQFNININNTKSNIIGKFSLFNVVCSYNKLYIQLIGEEH
ncbi:MAG: glycosyltransferase [Scandinavium sp.]|uniref:glycosyltransferase n=1 Tax=Scandinavium sp. TaxID=2830653 RepID=UPI003F2AEA1D